MEDFFNDYLVVLNSVCENLAQLVSLTQKEINAVLHDDLTALNEVLNQEQALALTFRGLNQKREDQLQRMGLVGVPLSQIAGHFPLEIRGEVSETISALENQSRMYRKYADQARDLLEQGIREIERTLTGMGAAPLGGAGYNQESVTLPPSMKTDFHA